MSEFDHKNLIREAYRIEGIQIEECRSIFLDWALSLPSTVNQRAALEHLFTQYGADAPEHPMTLVLKAGLEAPARAKRRGGRTGRGVK